MVEQKLFYLFASSVRNWTELCT